jgi:hypothetical protein
MTDYIKLAKNKVLVLIYGLVALSILLDFLGISSWFGFFVHLAELLIASFIGTAVAQTLVQSVSGDYLEGILFYWEILRFKLSISLFTIVTFIVEIWIL